MIGLFLVNMREKPYFSGGKYEKNQLNREVN